MAESEIAGGGIAMNIPVNEGELASCSSASQIKVPERLKKRLTESTKAPLSAEDIESKLREARLRRQQFHKLLSSKASLKSKSISQLLLREEGNNQQIEAKLNAAEQKRSSILAKAQERLARLDHLRQVAKVRSEKGRDEIREKAESRIQQAQTNKMLLLQAEGQRRAAKKERAAKSLMEKVTQERRYRERVHAAIRYKRAAAEKRRLGLLEAEKQRAHARVLQVQRVYGSISSRRENEKRRMRDQLERRLQRAENHREVYLKKRRSAHCLDHINSRPLCEKEILARKLARCWRQFKSSRKTTYDLAVAYEALRINKESARSLPFEQFAIQIESATTIQAVKLLCDRLETRLAILQAANCDLSGLNNIDHLLKRVIHANRKCSADARDSQGAKISHPSEDGAKKFIKLRRYPARVLLCAYMIYGHPDVVLSRKGEREIALADSVANFIQEFELLISIILNGSIQTPDTVTASGIPNRITFNSQLEAFDKAWCSYVYQLAAWKAVDAKSLEDDLVRAACQLELSMMQACRLISEGKKRRMSRDIKTIQKQVMENKKQIRAKVQDLGGSAGIEHLERALSDVRSRFLEAKEPGGSVGSSSAGSLVDSSAAGPSRAFTLPELNKKEDMSKISESHMVGSPVVHNPYTPIEDMVSSSPEKSTDTVGSDAMKVTENETIVNEIVHARGLGFASVFDGGDEEQNSLKAKVKDTMEKAFWDSITETLKHEHPDFSWVLKLVKEVRDELIEMSPKSWRHEIIESVDIDTVSQMLSSGKLDTDYLGKILDYGLATLQKLSAPANDVEMKAAQENLLKELAESTQSEDNNDSSSAILMIKGLRFVLQQIQKIKKEIGKARMKMLEPFIKGPSGIEYLKRAFLNRFGNPVHSVVSLPLTEQWLSSMMSNVQKEWEEHTDSLTTVMGSDSLDQGLPPTLRTGSRISKASPLTPTTSGNKLPECRGEKLDLLLRLGLLRLASQIVGLAPENLPETLKLNFSRLRNIQSQFQKIIVAVTSLLVLRQILLSEKLVATLADMENIISKCGQEIFQLLDNVENVGMTEIVHTILGSLKECNHITDQKKLEARMQVIANMLIKSLQAGDPVFERVSHTVYLAMRGAVLCGNGVKGRHLVETALRRVGALFLTDKVLEAAEVLTVIATVSFNVHRDWYEELLKSF